MMEPREIEDEGHERIIERVAAIDVAKASGMVCVRVPHKSRPGRRVSRVWEVAATTGAVTGLGDHLACQGPGKVFPTACHLTTPGLTIQEPPGGV
jgi:transposase